MEKTIDLSGKWKYKEDYGHGVATGELHLNQQGSRVKGRIIFTDTVREQEPFMIQEFVEGEIVDNKLILDAFSWDIIHSDKDIAYELDSWCGDIISDSSIKGRSMDERGVEGRFELSKIDIV
jgi:hypothetical protein